MINIYTHTDLDGVGCAVLATLAFKDCNIIYCENSDVDKKVEEGAENGTNFITDLSVSEELAERLDKINRSGKASWTLLDHHKTALPLNRFDWCTVKTEDPDTGIPTCGTELFYKFLYKNGFLKIKFFEKAFILTYLNKFNVNIPIDKAFYDTFVNAVRDWDTWRWSEIGKDGELSMDLNDLLKILGKEEFVKKICESIYARSFPYKYGVPYKDETVQTLLVNFRREKDEYIKKKLSNVRKVEVKNLHCGLVFADRFISEIGSEICKRDPDCDMAIIINMDGFYSFRTAKEQVDVSEIAKAIGGGGHKAAAGAGIKKSVMEHIVMTLKDGLS